MVTLPVKNVFNAVQAAALQSTEDTVIDILQRASSPSDVVRSEQLSQVRIKFTALTDRATAILKQNSVEISTHNRKTVSTD